MSGWKSGRFATSRVRRQSHLADQGFTLAEVLVAIGIFTVISVTATFGMTRIVQGTRATTDRVTASNLARQQIELLRLQNVTAGAFVLGTTVPPPVHGVTYTVFVSMSPNPIATVSSTSTLSPPPDCLAAANTFSPQPPTQRAVTIQVRWRGDEGRAVRYDTALTC